ncbi:MAG: hypothetical protein WCS37_20985, partial [Chloroflexota bacterium]
TQPGPLPPEPTQPTTTATATRQPATPTTQPTTTATATRQPATPTVTKQPPTATVKASINIDSTDKAFSLLFDKLKQDKIYSDGLGCLSFQDEDQGTNYFQIALREKHGGTCPGDPNTAPVRDRFKVYANGDIFWLNIITDKEVPYSDFKKTRS